MVPLGYDTKDRKITVNHAEAERVRTIFRLYLQLGSLDLLMAGLRRQGIVSKVRTLKSGKTVGGIPFTRGPLAHLLRNRFYIGEVAFKGEVLKGEQPAILDRDLFKVVQAKLDALASRHTASRAESEASLTGRIFDDAGNRMSPTHARKGGIKYRYYLSAALLHDAAEQAGSVRRVPAAEIESVVVKSVRQHLGLSLNIDDRSVIERNVGRVEVHCERLTIQLARAQANNPSTELEDTIQVPWRKTTLARRREILVPEGTALEKARPIRSENRATLVASIARGRRRLDELIADATASAESIAKRQGCSIRKVNMTVSLAFLAPDLVKAAIEGRLPHRMGVTRLIDLPAEWSRQRQMLGLPA
jgi:site-specific DNA recombinase